MIMLDMDDAAVGDPLPLDRQLFSPGLRTFHKRLAGVAWQEEAGSCVFVRDYGGLPDTAPFDIDIMVDRSELGRFRSVFETNAQAARLACITREVPSGLHILLLDLVVAPAFRTWAYYEIATAKKLTRSFVLTSGAIAVQSDGGLPIPDPRWRFLIDFAQALRKGDISRYEQSLKGAIEVNPNCIDLCVSTLGLRPADIHRILSDPSQMDHVADRIGIAKKKPKPVADLPLRTRLRRTALRHLYFLPTPQMHVFTIHGPDGVGKSTAGNLVKDMFAGHPFGMEYAHHVTSWKHKQNPDAGGATADVSLTHKILRVIYRAAPQFARDIWVTSSGYHKYSRNVNAEVYRSYTSRNILLLDRYIYDLSVKDKVRGTSSRISNSVSQLHCLIMRRPSLAILLQDRPSEIIKRKQELNEAEIRDYQILLRKMLQRLRVRFEIIEVGGRTRNEIARDLATAIIEHVGVDLHVLMRHELSRLAQKPAPRDSSVVGDISEPKQDSRRAAAPPLQSSLRQ